MVDVEERRLAAWQAGRDYWRRNKPTAHSGDVQTVARSCGWDGELADFWLAGFLGAKNREGGSNVG